MAYRYIDRLTGKWVSQTTWKRSKAQGGIRYKRHLIKKAPPAPKRAPKPVKAPKSVKAPRRPPKAPQRPKKAPPKKAPKAPQRAPKPGKALKPVKAPKKAPKAPRKPKKAPPKRGPDINYIVTVQVRSPRRSPRTGRMRQQDFTRDILIPGPPGATQKQLLDIARETLPAKEQYVIDWFAKRNKPQITIAEGKPTKARKATLR